LDQWDLQDPKEQQEILGFHVKMVKRENKEVLEIKDLRDKLEKMV